MAQLVSVPPCHGGGCGFESRLDRHLCRCSSMVEHDLAMVDTGVRFPSSAPLEYSGPIIRSFFYFYFFLDRHLCRCSSMVEHDLAMVDTGVRFPSSAPLEYSGPIIRSFFYFYFFPDSSSLYSRILLSYLLFLLFLQAIRICILPDSVFSVWFSILLFPPNCLSIHFVLLRLCRIAPALPICFLFS